MYVHIYRYLCMYSKYPCGAYGRVGASCPPARRPAARPPAPGRPPSLEVTGLQLVYIYIYIYIYARGAACM